MHPKEAEEMANSVAPCQTALSVAVWTGSALLLRSVCLKTRAESLLIGLLEFLVVMMLYAISVSDSALVPRSLRGNAAGAIRVQGDNSMYLYYLAVLSSCVQSK